MPLYATVVEYYLRASELYVFTDKDKATAKAKEIKENRLDKMDILQKRYYKLYVIEVEEGQDCLPHYSLSK